MVYFAQVKIGIIGTRGIPNRYGGFEQFAEYLSVGLVKLGHNVVVYNPHHHPYAADEFNGVKIVRCNDPEDNVGTAGQFIYDFNCIMDSRKQNFDIILQLGYTSSSIWSFLFPKKALLFTNMDGLEWKRSKYGNTVKKFLKKAEAWGAKYSDYLIADSIGIQSYLKETYNKESTYIAYGSEIVNKFSLDRLNEANLGLQMGEYYLLIARMEPENNIEMILEGFVKSKSEKPFIVIGNWQNNEFGKQMHARFSTQNVQFIGGIYNQELLNDIRYFSAMYFHGHSVGGTNPSLLEAMGSKAIIAANNNAFNKAILEEDAFYFSDSNEVANLIQAIEKPGNYAKSEKMKANNAQKIEKLYTWDKIIKDYETLFLSKNA